jgi:hypothetical protein
MRAHALRRNSSEVWSHHCLCTVVLMRAGKKPDCPAMESGRSIDPNDAVCLQTYLTAPIFSVSVLSHCFEGLVRAVLNQRRSGGASYERQHGTCRRCRTIAKRRPNSLPPCPSARGAHASAHCHANRQAGGLAVTRSARNPNRPGIAKDTRKNNCYYFGRGMMI